MKVDCHVHTAYSSTKLWKRDGFGKPEEIVKLASRSGLGGIAITDHHEIKGARAAEKKGRRAGIVVIPGVEIRTEKGDVLALNVTEIPKGSTAEEVCENVKEMGGLTVAAHPFSSSPLRKGGAHLVAEAVEVLNSWSSRRDNRKAESFAGAAGKPFTAGSDAHFPELVGSAGIICSGETPDEILEEIRKRRVRVFGKELPILKKAVLSIRKVAGQFA